MRLFKSFKMLSDRMDQIYHVRECLWHSKVKRVIIQLHRCFCHNKWPRRKTREMLSGAAVSRLHMYFTFHLNKSRWHRRWELPVLQAEFPPAPVEGRATLAVPMLCWLWVLSNKFCTILCFWLYRINHLFNRCIKLQYVRICHLSNS